MYSCSQEDSIIIIPILWWPHSFSQEDSIIIISILWWPQNTGYHILGVH